MFLKTSLGKTTANFKFAFKHIGLVINKSRIIPTRTKYFANKTYINQTSDYVQMFKVDSYNFEYDKVIDILSNEENLKLLNENNIFNDDNDFTQDFTGLIMKEEVTDSVLTNHEFRKQGTYELAKHTILDIAFESLKNCLTFMKNTANGHNRFKFYNKFVQCLESPSVKDLVGSHIGDYVSSPNANLK